MKIIHIITAFGIGGAEKLLLSVVNKQVKEHEVHLIYLKPITDLLDELDNKVKTVYIPLSLKTIHDLKKYYKIHNPDIIHTHLGHADLLGLWSAKSLKKTKLFCTIHSTFFKESFFDVVMFKIYTLLFKSKKKKINVISISKSVEQHVLKKLKLPHKQSILLYNGIPEIKNYNKNITKTSEEINILFVGRLVKQKSIHTLIKAIKKLENKKIKLTIVGDGILKNKLIELTEELKISHLINFVGKKNNTDKFYNNANIFVLPSVKEGFGIVILEAFQSKTAVIASNIEGPAELIQDKKTGLLFTPKDEVELAEKINLLIQNTKLRNEIIENAYSNFKDNFSLNVYVKKLNSLYQQ